MTRQPHVARRAEELLGSAVAATAPVAGGDISTATKLRLSNGALGVHEDADPRPGGLLRGRGRRAALARRGRRRPGARGARRRARLPDPGAGSSPGKLTTEAAGDFGRALARTHDAGAPAYGLDRDGFIGRLPLPNKTRADLGGVLRDQAGAALPQAGPRPRRHHRPRAPTWSRGSSAGFADLVPEEGPRRLHGDLWNGNVIWTHDAGCCVIDPAAHGGHRETDLAMLALFGLPHLPRVLAGLRGGLAARRRLGGPGRPPPAASRCSCTPACSAAGTARAPPRWPAAMPDRGPRPRSLLRRGSGRFGTVSP